MQPIRYTRTQEASAAIELATREPGAAYLAGGTTLLDLMKLEVKSPTLLVDVRQLNLAQVEELPEGGLRLGALARNADVAHHALVRERYPVLSQALLAGASPQIRNMATVGGNLMQRTRCPYFRDVASRCNKREPGQGCQALEGPHRTHAVLGTSDRCICTHPSDMCVALAALGATVHLRGPRGERGVALTDFHLLPGSTPHQETVLEHGELIVAVELPALALARRSLYLKVRDRASYAFALASVAAALEVEGGVVRQARLALGGVGTKPWRAWSAEAFLAGRPATPESFQQAATLALEGARPRTDNAFKVELAQRLVVRALSRLNGGGA